MDTRLDIRLGCPPILGIGAVGYLELDRLPAAPRSNHSSTDSSVLAIVIGDVADLVTAPRFPVWRRAPARGCNSSGECPRWVCCFPQTEDQLLPSAAMPAVWGVSAHQGQAISASFVFVPVRQMFPRPGSSHACCAVTRRQTLSPVSEIMPDRCTRMRAGCREDGGFFAAVAPCPDAAVGVLAARRHTSGGDGAPTHGRVGARLEKEAVTSAKAAEPTPRWAPIDRAFHRWRPCQIGSSLSRCARLRSCSPRSQMTTGSRTVFQQRARRGFTVNRIEFARRSS